MAEINPPELFIGSDAIQPFSQEPVSMAEQEAKPQIILMGLRRCGKSSIAQVVFNKITPNGTVLLESTTKIEFTDIETNTFLHYELVEIPGQMDIFESTVPMNHEGLFSNCDAVIYIIDCSDSYESALPYLYQIVTCAHKINPKIRFEVFIHKTDVLRQDGDKLAIRRSIYYKVTRDLQDSCLEAVKLHFYLTSIYDYSIFEALSSVVQKLIPELPTLENMLNLLNQKCRIEKSYLFDLHSKIYIATDSTPLDIAMYALVSDMIDTVLDLANIYDSGSDAKDANLSSTFELNNKSFLFLKKVNQYLALVVFMTGEDLQETSGLIEYNFYLFKKALENVFEIRTRKSKEKLL
ncbi:hypothetical protein LOD99_13538 [Oopsacas minuta]|uniref:Uncharacterized protein n=1 Tax=Oopsacas minuta TaxID=111878 RepID=A0AAV7KL66_9METZ|nr:hypothetical protein LOD99_13538 [Oopsacas minuta]